ncbi:MAG: hypothetical protein BGO37_10625 [Cellulomonas sp. 73-92]|uniref:hypothetical protein n=1 Tax=Cellulomonas sp. 73-92 TaxID=1895740 RepID=UPI000927FAF2|nr:hypothetical protein [Cellulomonas sp. 73-92]OJV76503.1 MAG: hypothetical protein BGO37_10625 [Cellulomonas sp. 73-92]
MAFDDIPDDIKKNYEQLIKDRGWDHETAAANYEQADPRLAAYLRSLGTDDPKTEPKGRKGSARSKVAEATTPPTPPAAPTPPATADGSTPPATPERA